MAEDSVISASYLVVIGGSAGSIEVLMRLLPDWPVNDRLAAVIVLHRKADGDSPLTDLFISRSSWPVGEAGDKDLIMPGHIYLAPADYHLLIETDHTFSLDYSEKINYSRPSIDATFETAALAYGTDLTCLLLSGANADGAAGLCAAKQLGSTVAVQDPATAVAPYMPQHALQLLKPDAVLAPEMLADFFEKIVQFMDKN
jgi:two-component system chemotaxis response regulator CheB